MVSEAVMAEVTALRPELHRYCARLMGSVIDGEDVIQDVLVKVMAGVPAEAGALRPWLFRVAHNRAMDVLRGRAVRATAALDEVAEPADPGPDGEAVVMRRQAVGTAVSRFAELPVMQRAAVVLRDVLDAPLSEIAGLLDLSVDAVKGHLARGRARLREIGGGAEVAVVRPVSVETARYVAMFNRHDWEGLRALLAEDARLKQSDHPLRTERVGEFFGFYARNPDVRVAAGWLDGREVVAVYEGASGALSHVMWLEWRDGRIGFIRDYRYVSYVVTEAGLVLA